MKLIIDANRVIACLMKEGTTRSILFNKNFEFFSPDYILSEIQKYEEDLRKRLNLGKGEFEILLGLIFENITIIPKEGYENFLKVCRDKIGDIKDVPYLACCIACRAEGVWSHDKHILEQHFVKSFTNINLLEIDKRAKSE